MRAAPIDVSVIIPAFNRLWCLPHAVQSCRGTRCNTEIIVIDDGSTDGTWEWLAQQNDIVALRQDNWGKDWAVNRGFARARGEYVRFLDSDDWLAPGAIDRQLDIARQENADVVVAGMIVRNEIAGTETVQDWVACDDFIAQQLGECDSSHYSAYLFRRAFIADIPHRQEFGAKDDRLFVIEVAIGHPNVAVCGEPTFVHRHHAQARLQNPAAADQAAARWWHLELYRKAASLLAARGELNERRKRAIAKSLWRVAHWTAYTDYSAACGIAKWVRELDPGFVPPEGGLLGYLYRRTGFAFTERILCIRRRILKPFR